MNLIRKIFKNTTYKDDLNKRREEFVALVDQLKSKIKLAETLSEILLKERFKSLSLLQELRRKISSIKDSPECVYLGIERANGFMSIIKEAYKSVDTTFLPEFTGGGLQKSFESDQEKTNLSTAIAISTTFGIAISRFTTTNMALSGLGMLSFPNIMISGSALLTLLGPIGWSILGIAGGYILSNSLKGRGIENENKIRELQENLSKLVSTIEIVNQMIDDVSQLKDKTSFYNKELHLLINKLNSIGIHDFEDEQFPKEELFKSVEIAKFIGKLSRQIVKTPSYDRK